jgi:hypothetical protein
LIGALFGLIKKKKKKVDLVKVGDFDFGLGQSTQKRVKAK